MEATSALNAWNASAVQKVQTTIGTSAGLPSLDIAFYKGATPHKMGRISTECAVLMGSTLVNLLLLDSRSSSWCSSSRNNWGGHWCCPSWVVWLGRRHAGSWCSYKRTEDRTSKEELSSFNDVSDWIWVRRLMSGFGDEQALADLSLKVSWQTG